MTSTESRYSVELSKDIVESEARQVCVRWPIDLEVVEALEALAQRLFGEVTASTIGRLTGERDMHMTVVFPDGRRANAVNFAGLAEQLLADAERRATLKLYSFETASGPPVYLALHPKRRAHEAYALLAGADLADADDDVTAADLAAVSQETAQRLNLRDDDGTLWEAFSSKTSPCIVASGDPENA